MILIKTFGKAFMLCALSVIWGCAQTGTQQTDSAVYGRAGGSGMQPSRNFELLPSESTVLTLDLTSKANDVWDRIRRGFSMPNLEDEVVQQQMDAYLRKPESLQRIFARGRPYLYYIIEQLEVRGMPTELALLPMVESAYNPRAYSRAQAAGLWQFIPSTGRNYNLTQNSWVDERRDVVASTNAALDYLQTIYEMHGDWHLALASYNWGEGAVKRAVEKNKQAGLATDFSSLTMPSETRKYVPRLQALKNIVLDPERYGIELPQIENDRYFVTVDGPVGVDLKTLASMANMDTEEFLALNPGYKRAILPSGRATLVLPEDRAESFVSRMASQGQPLRRWQIYTLGRKEKLAAVAQRFGLSTEELLEINSLNSGTKLSAGFPLIVPAVASGSPSLVLSLPEPAPVASPAKTAKEVDEKPRASKKDKRAAQKEAREDKKRDSKKSHGKAEAEKGKSSKHKASESSSKSNTDKAKTKTKAKAEAPAKAAKAAPKNADTKGKSSPAPKASAPKTPPKGKSKK